MVDIQNADLANPAPDWLDSILSDLIGGDPTIDLDEHDKTLIRHRKTQRYGIPRAKQAITRHIAEEVAAAEKVSDELLTERDLLETRLDSLSNAVAACFGQDIGEHSSMNDPWYNAYELLRDNTPSALRGGSEEQSNG